MSADSKKRENIDQEIAAPEIPDHFWWIGCLAVTAIAILIRVYWIELKPLHHDEGVNGFFLTTLFREGIYKYDAGNYHGPTLYFISLAFTKILGLETFAVRYSVVLFGVGIVVLTFFLRRYIGSIGALSAALFLTLSPGMVFISRYFIHEILFVFFTYGMVVAIIYFMEKESAGIGANVLMSVLLLVCLMPIPLFLPGLIADRFPATFGDLQNTAGTILRSFFFFLEAVIVFLTMLALSRWRNGRPVYLILASASCALIFATKETAFISLGTMAIACFCIWVFRSLFIDRNRLEPSWPEPVELTPRTFIKSFGTGIDAILLAVSVVTIFIYVWVLFFSSFFTFPEGLGRSIDAYNLWTQTGTKEHADKKFYIYFEWMALLEGPIFCLGVLGAWWSSWIARHRFAMFSALWAFGLLLAYTIIPYKTPWLALSFILPMCLIAGYAINELAISKEKWQKWLAAVATVLATGILAVQAVELNFFSYDNERRPYVYAQTKRGYVDLTKTIEEFAQRTGKGNELSIAIVSKDYWPMPWDVREYPKAVFHGEPVPANMVDLIITSEEQENKCLEQEFPDAKCRQLDRYGDNYEVVGTYPLRPAVELKIYARNDILGKPLYNRKPKKEEIINPIEYPGGDSTPEEDKK